MIYILKCKKNNEMDYKSRTCDRPHGQDWMVQSTLVYIRLERNRVLKLNQLEIWCPCGMTHEPFEPYPY